MEKNEQLFYENLNRRIFGVYSQTKKLGMVNMADPLGSSLLRVRGMWQIMDPANAFSSVAPPLQGRQFFAYAIMEKEKAISMRSILNGVSTRDARLPGPNNPAKLMDAVIMEVSW
jgi:hypothetical protein